MPDSELHRLMKILAFNIFLQLSQSMTMQNPCIFVIFYELFDSCTAYRAGQARDEQLGLYLSKIVS